MATNNSIITISDMSPMAKNFKDERLNQATRKIADIYSNARKYVEDKNAEIARVLADVAAQKSYQADGFKSVADYAKTVFGIDRQKSYALAAAGKVYNDSKANPELKAMPYSKLAAISSVDDNIINEAIKSGAINRNTTQADLKAFAKKAAEEKAASEPQKPEILKVYTASPKMLYTGEDEERWEDDMSQPRTLEDWDKWFNDYVIMRSPGFAVETIVLPKGKLNSDSKKAIIHRHLYMNMNFSLVVEFFEHTPKPSKTKAKEKRKDLSDFTIEELRAMLRSLEAEQDDKTVKG